VLVYEVHVLIHIVISIKYIAFISFTIIITILLLVLSSGTSCKLRFFCYFSLFNLYVRNYLNVRLYVHCAFLLIVCIFQGIDHPVAVAEGAVWVVVELVRRIRKISVEVAVGRGGTVIVDWVVVARRVLVVEESPKGVERGCSTVARGLAGKKP